MSNMGEDERESEAPPFLFLSSVKSRSRSSDVENRAGYDLLIGGRDAVRDRERQGNAGSPPEPSQFAREFGVSGVRLRGYLRNRYPDEAPGSGGRWRLRPEQVADLREYFGARHRGEATVGARVAARVAFGGPYHDAWFWEGSVQRVIAAHLERAGWTIESMADTAIKAQGDDIRARSGGRVLRVEVKGWPSKGHADVRRATEAKPTGASVQAGHWYSQALLGSVRDLNDHPTDEVAIGLPDMPRFRSLIAGTEAPLRRLGIGVYLVREGGAVETLLPHVKMDVTTHARMP
jgi:hypothetical protein